MICVDFFPEKEAKDLYETLLENEMISQQIMKLSPKYKEVILLYYYQELCVKESAGVLNQKESTILQRLKRARAHLKPLLKEVRSGWKK